MPVIDPGHPPEGVAGAAENGDVVHTGNAEIIELGKNPFALVEDVFPHCCIDDAGNGVRDEIQQPEEHLPAGDLRKEKRPEQSHCDRDAQEEAGPDDDVPECFTEVLVVREVAKIL